MHSLKVGAKWAAKAYLYLLLAMLAVAFIGGVLSDPFNAVTGGGGPVSDACLEWGNC